MKIREEKKKRRKQKKKNGNIKRRMEVEGEAAEAMEPEKEMKGEFSDACQKPWFSASPVA